MSPEADKVVAEIATYAAKAAPLAGSMMGEFGPIGAEAFQAVMNELATSLNERGVTAAQIVSTLRDLKPLNLSFVDEARAELEKLPEKAL